MCIKFIARQTYFVINHKKKTNENKWITGFLSILFFFSVSLYIFNNIAKNLLNCNNSKYIYTHSTSDGNYHRLFEVTKNKLHLVMNCNAIWINDSYWTLVMHWLDNPSNFQIKIITLVFFKMIDWHACQMNPIFQNYHCGRISKV